METLSTRFNSKVELDTLDVSLFHGLQVSGSGLRIYPPDDVVAAGANYPIIALRQTSTFRAGVMGLFIKPTHVNTVHVSGLDHPYPAQAVSRSRPALLKKRRGKIKFRVGEILFDDSQLIIASCQSGQGSEDTSSCKHIVLNDVGSATSAVAL